MLVLRTKVWGGGFYIDHVQSQFQITYMWISKTCWTCLEKYDYSICALGLGKYVLNGAKTPPLNTKDEFENIFTLLKSSTSGFQENTINSKMGEDTCDASKRKGSACRTRKDTGRAASRWEKYNPAAKRAASHAGGEDPGTHTEPDWAATGRTRAQPRP